MRIVILHNEVSPDDRADERDVLVQRDAVAEVLRRLGHGLDYLGCTLDLGAVRSRLEALRPDVIFNLTEALGGSDRLAPLATLLLDALGIPYTGSPTEALIATNNKVGAKQRLCEAGLPTPAWITADGRRHGAVGAGVRDGSRGPSRTIVKAVWEHASVGIDEESLVSGDDAEAIADRIQRRAAVWGRACFAEAFVDGREFNISVLASPEGPQVLPHAEIDFSAFPADKPRIVDYRAKWDEESFEYHHTPRRFEFSEADRSLLDKLGDLARRCWMVFGLRGYVRVDFRVDRDGQPWILEVNPNPCLSPDAGFAAALAQAGMPYEEAIRRIVEDAIR
jgi:D-alanine-D-alanine ligase